MPWNFPFWQVFRFAAPALMAGNVGLLKHASNVPQCALGIEEIFRARRLPGGRVPGAAHRARDRCRGCSTTRASRAVTLTGSEAAGPAAWRSAPGGSSRRRCSSSAAAIPSSSCPARTSTRRSRRRSRRACINNGQSCIAAKRFIVAEAVADAFERRFVRARCGALRVGDPLDETHRGRPAGHRADLATSCDEQVRRSVAAGARVLTGGHRLDRPGHYYAADRPRRRPARRARGPRGGVRPRGRALPGRGHRRRHPAGQRHAVRPGLQRLDDATRPSARRVIAEIEAGQVFVNAMVASRPAAAVRRREALRLRPRARRLRHPRVRQRQDGLDRGERRRRRERY